MLLQIRAAILLIATVAVVNAHLSDHTYKQHEAVELYVNKVGPYANPAEAFEYYTLPYCAPDTNNHPEHADKNSDGYGKFNEWKVQNIGEYLGGHSLRHSGHDITFDPESTVKNEACTSKPLTDKDVQVWSKAIEERWFYQMYLDDLPVWGMVGEMLPEGDKGNLEVKEKDDLDRLDRILEESLSSGGGNLKPYLYTTRNLLIRFNDDQIVQVDLTSDPASLVELKVGAELAFTMQITWEKTTDHFHSRFDRYLDHDFFKHPIHWFSLFNSFMMVLFLMGLVGLILLRTLKQDYAKYGIVYDLDTEAGDGTAGGEERGDDAGWKQVHGDVFRAPIGLPFIAALLGSGWQLIVLICGVVLFAVLGPVHGEVHEERGKLWQSILFFYTLSSIVSGYMSGKYFKLYYPTTPEGRRTGGTTGNKSGSAAAQWQLTMGLTVILLPVITISILSILNMMSIFYGTINAIPFLVILKLFFIWIFISVPLCVVGTLLGRHTSLNGDKGLVDNFPCRVNAIPRIIPEDVPWFGKPLGLLMVSGTLSFGSIFIELYYVLTSLWNYKFYHVYGFLLGVYMIMTIVVSMTSIISVYFLLNAENYHWQWTAFGSGASISIYVFLYTIYYFIFKTQMSGLLQTTFYFGYMFVTSLILGILCGTVGHAAASKFVRSIFENVKVD